MRNKTFKDNFKYRAGDKVKSINGAEFEILAVDSTAWNEHYRLKNLSKGCLDQPFWINRYNLFSNYEPCNPAIKILFEKESVATLTVDHMLDAMRYMGMGNIVRKPKFYPVLKKVTEDDPN